jgi:hypothetical protein
MKRRLLMSAVIGEFVLSMLASAQEAPSNDAIFGFDDPDGAWWVHAINLPAAWQTTRGETRT